MEIVTYKCPCCDGPLEFGSDTQELECPFCGNKYTLETLKQYYGENDKKDNEAQWDKYTKDSGSGDWSEEEKSNLRTYTCPACGAEIVAEDNIGATSCVYCGNPTIIPKQFEGSFRPDMIIPFKLDKDSAVAELNKFVKGKKLLPKEYKNKIEEIKGIYVPFWLYDCDTHANIRYKATRVTAWSDSQYNYTKTDHYMVTREGDVSFSRVPADGAKNMDDAYMDSIEPFNYKDAVDFQLPYLSGYVAEKYDVDANENMERVNNRIKKSTQDLFARTVNGYATQIVENQDMDLKHGEIKYALFPVWLLRTKYKDKIYTFAMNGQTGKFVGELPVSIGKCWGWFFGIFVSISIILSLILYLM